MTTYTPKAPGSGLSRGDDGIMIWHGGRHYTDPGEAVKTWWGGVLRCGCAESVHALWSSSPCGKIPKHDPDANGRPTKCGMHSAAAKAKRKAASDAHDAAARAGRNLREALHDARNALEPALRQIADGHNDPSALAREILAALDAAREAVKGQT